MAQAVCVERATGLHSLVAKDLTPLMLPFQLEDEAKERLSTGTRYALREFLSAEAQRHERE
jgi:hypothetical protein